MTQAFSENVGAKNLGGADGDQIPAANTYDTFESTSNKRLEMEQILIFDNASTTSEDIIMQFTAPDNGRIAGIRYANGATAMDGTNGWELEWLNQSNSDDRIAYFGIGSGTEAAKATDTDTSVLANANAFIANSDVTSTSRFNKGDNISCVGDRDGTAGVGSFELILELASAGR